ncbi:MAG: hypothetical protein KJ622_00505 [Alphaproteobacteria bacterium]|nr:hypothetical protein [Alphaproteobacteria bacterium]
MKILISLLLLCGCLLHPMTSRASETNLDHASLKAMIEGLGYEPVEKTYSDSGAKFWELSFPRGPWTYTVAVNANSRETLWTSVEFAVYKGPPENIPQSALLGMLLENTNLKWSQFRYQANTHSFFLVSVLRNKTISPADLRRVIDEIVAAADRTQKLWDPKLWPKSAGAKFVKAVPEAAGAAQK